MTAGQGENRERERGSRTCVLRQWGEIEGLICNSKLFDCLCLQDRERIERERETAERVCCDIGVK